MKIVNYLAGLVVFVSGIETCDAQAAYYGSDGQGATYGAGYDGYQEEQAYNGYDGGYGGAPAQQTSYETYGYGYDNAYGAQQGSDPYNSGGGYGGTSGYGYLDQGQQQYQYETPQNASPPQAGYGPSDYGPAPGYGPSALAVTPPAPPKAPPVPDVQPVSETPATETIDLGAGASVSDEKEDPTEEIDLSGSSGVSPALLKKMEEEANKPPPPPPVPKPVADFLVGMKSLQQARLLFAHLEGQNWLHILDDGKQKSHAFKIPEVKSYNEWLYIDFARVFGHYSRFRDALAKVFPDQKELLNKATVSVEEIKPLPDIVSMDREKAMKTYASLAQKKAQEAYNGIKKSGGSFFADAKVKTLLEKEPDLKKNLMTSGGWIHKKLLWVIKHLGNAEKHVEKTLEKPKSSPPPEKKKEKNEKSFWAF
ncbi:hypothetical protein OAN22_00135 [Alphaproteobacteria bacterium]|nr:hypothetical protein [Alphaproteobacteria bacterium]